MRGLKYLDMEVIDFDFSKYENDEGDGEFDLDIDVSFEYGIGVDEEDMKCLGEATVTISDVSHSFFELRVHVGGIFSIREIPANDEQSNELHRASLKEFMPHINSLISNLSNIAGVPSVPISYDDFVEGEGECRTEGLN